LSTNELIARAVLFAVSITASFVTVAFLSPVIIHRKVALNDAARAVLIGSIGSLAITFAIGAVSDGMAGFVSSVLAAIAVNVLVLSRIVPVDEVRTLGVKHATFLVLLSGGMNIALLGALRNVLGALTGA
jgi:hypothetical protein